MAESRLLIVFVKNARKGRVKTRLAKTIGNERALLIYRTLLKLTSEMAEKVNAVRQVWYSDSIELNDMFRKDLFEKFLQKGSNLGERMHLAFDSGFRSGFEKVLLVGSDCPDISQDMVEKAFRELEDSDMVIGPSRDGGYYLIGFSSHAYDPDIFEGIKWSTPVVLSQTLEIAERKGLSTARLAVLNDIDTEEDLNQSRLQLEQE